jgi:predicted kinase
MALTIQQQIASIENQLARLKDQLEQNNPNKEQTFHITFEYKTRGTSWPQGERVDEEQVRDQINDRLADITVELQFDEPGEQFNLLTVRELSTPPPD